VPAVLAVGGGTDGDIGEDIGTASGALETLVIIGQVNEVAGSRLVVGGEVAGLRDTVRSQAVALGLSGWVRLIDEDETLRIHVEGPPSALEQFVQWLGELDGVSSLQRSSARVEGHEQFAVRGVPAGVFVVQEHQATAHHFDLRLEVGGVMRSWAVPKGPSLDPSVKRFAIQVEDHGVEHNEFEGRTPNGGVIVWDRGLYEQSGRVPWPEALDRGHAVFVLHGAKLRGGFALQRTQPGDRPQWLLIKRRDEHVKPGSDIVTERPESVASGTTLSQLLEIDA
jgi:DNA ligase D-like protein (predicted 3'-phosphoesterase)